MPFQCLNANRFVGEFVYQSDAQCTLIQPVGKLGIHFGVFGGEQEIFGGMKHTNFSACSPPAGISGLCVGFKVSQNRCGDGRRHVPIGGIGEKMHIGDGPNLTGGHHKVIGQAEGTGRIGGGSQDGIGGEDRTDIRAASTLAGVGDNAILSGASDEGAVVID